MEILKGMAALVGWFGLGLSIAAVLVYPFALWMAKHTSVSEKALGQTIIAGVGLLWMPAWILVDFVYGRFRRSKKRSPAL